MGSRDVPVCLSDQQKRSEYIHWSLFILFVLRAVPNLLKMRKGPRLCCKDGMRLMLINVNDFLYVLCSLHPLPRTCIFG